MVAWWATVPRSVLFDVEALRAQCDHVVEMLRGEVAAREGVVVTGEVTLKVTEEDDEARAARQAHADEWADAAGWPRSPVPRLGFVSAEAPCVRRSGRTRQG